MNNLQDTTELLNYEPSESLETASLESVPAEEPQVLEQYAESPTTWVVLALGTVALMRFMGKETR